MEEYTNLAREYVSKFQPRLESTVGVELGKIEVKENSNIPGKIMQGGDFNRNKTDILFELEVNERSYAREFVFSPDKVIDFSIQTDTVHELAHMFQIKNMFNRMQQIKSRPHTSEEIKPFKQFFSDGYKFPKCFRSFLEGFAWYMAYDLWSWVYDKDLKVSGYIDTEKKNLLSGPSFSKVTEYYGLKHDPYYEGYKFFRGIINRLESFPIKLSTIPPRNLREIRNPDLYLQRVTPSAIAM